MPENTDFEATGELAKELGLLEALTIGVGTMIGAGVFILPSLALEMAGPGAIISYIAAGIICMITAASTAELATGMPKSGGAYFFISRSMGGLLGTVSGVTVWLSLTFAVAFYLQGFGEYLALMLPVDATILAILACIFFTYINYIGAKETGKTQNIIVGILVVILGFYVIGGSFYLESANFTPFFPQDFNSIFLVTALIFVSFLGFVQIASVAEEIKDPGYTMPRAIIGSVAIVTFIYALVILITSGVLPYSEVIQFEAPIVEVARYFSGFIGAAFVTFAALLATASSANASILASSRISFALGRDNILPQWLNEIHPKFLTPYRPILLTGILTFVLIILGDVELLSNSASVLMLINYALINFTVLIMRIVPPEGYEPSFKSPGFPYLHIFGGITSFLVILVAAPMARYLAISLIVFSFIWFMSWGKKKVEIRGAAENLSLKKILSFKPEKPKVTPPATNVEVEEDLEKNIYRILVPMANPAHEVSMLRVSTKIAKSQPQEGELDLLNVIKIPEQSPLDLAQYREKTIDRRKETYQKMLNIATEYGNKEQIMINPRIMYSRSRRKTIKNIIASEKINFLLLGWYDSMNIANIYNSLVKDLIRTVPCPVGVLKDKGFEKIENILIPYRGSEHAYWAVQLAAKMLSSEGEITILRVIKPGVDAAEEKEAAEEEIQEIKGENINIKVVSADEVVTGILKEENNNNYDIIFMGASKEWRFKNMLFGSIPDIIAEKAETSILMLRSYNRNIEEELTDENEEDEEKIPVKF